MTAITDPQTWLWFTIDVIGVLILGGALAYGIHSWNTRPRDVATQVRSDEATRRLYSSDPREDEPALR